MTWRHERTQDNDGAVGGTSPTKRTQPYEALGEIMVITLSVIIWWILIGLVVGAVARLVIPGRQHIGILVTILIGIVAAIVGGILTAALLGAGHTLITFIVAVLLAALAVSAFSTRGYGRYHTRSRRRPAWRR